MQNYCISSYVVFIQCECDKCFSFATKWNRRKTRNKTLLKKDRKTYIQVISSKWFDVESFVCTLKFLLTNTANFLQSIAKSDTTKKNYKLFWNIYHTLYCWEWYYRHYMVYIIHIHRYHTGYIFFGEKFSFQI